MSSKAELTDEDREVAKMIFDSQQLLYTDMRVAFPEGIRQYHLTSMAGSFLQMLMSIPPRESRLRMWQAIQDGINKRFEDGRL